MSLVKHVCYFWATCLFLFKFTPCLHSTFVSHSFMITLQRCWCFLPVVEPIVGKMLFPMKPMPSFFKNADKQSKTLCPLTRCILVMHWSNQLLLNLFCWFLNGCAGYFWITGCLRPSRGWSSAAMQALSAAIAGRSPSSSPFSEVS